MRLGNQEKSVLYNYLGFNISFSSLYFNNNIYFWQIIYLRAHWFLKVENLCTYREDTVFNGEMESNYTYTVSQVRVDSIGENY